jgi:hypothetical protein
VPEIVNKNANFRIFAKILEFIFPRFGPVVGTMEQQWYHGQKREHPAKIQFPID